MRLRPALHALLLTTASGALVLAAAAPGVAAGADRKTYRASMDSNGSVQGSFGGLELVDYLSGKYQDRLIGSAPRSTSFTVGGKPCANGSLRLNGHNTLDWANAVDGTQAGNLQVSCTLPDGSKHRYWWGVEHLGNWTFKDTNCLMVTRQTHATTTTFTVTTQSSNSAGALVSCPAQDELLDSAANTVTSTPNLHMPFGATFTVSGLVPIKR